MCTCRDRRVAKDTVVDQTFRESLKQLQLLRAQIATLATLSALSIINELIIE